MAAKRSPERRFHALYDRIFRSDVLEEAWRRVRENGGAAGIDGESLVEIERRGACVLLRELRADLRAGRYQPQPVRRRYIPKPDGRQRPLGIPTVRDRIVQVAAKIVLEPIFEAGFKEGGYGFRPRRSATQALEVLRLLGARGYRHVVDGDITSYFDTIDHGVLMELVAKRISDRRVLKLVRKWLEAGVMEEGVVRETLLGSPQGGVISPLLANIYLGVLDTVWARRCRDLGVLVRYADDFVVMCRTEADAFEAKRRIEIILGKLRLELHPEKTRIVELSLAQTGEGALAEISNNLQRIRELAAQASNSTNSASDRAALDAEVQQRIAEIDRTASTASFNNQKVLDGNFGTATFQVGANVGETISVALSTSMRTTAIGKTADYVNGTTQYSSTLSVGQQGTGVNVSNALASGDLNVALGSNSATAVPASAGYAGSGQGQGATSAYAKVAAINAAGIGGLTATTDTTVVFDFSGDGYCFHLYTERQFAGGPRQSPNSQQPLCR